MRILPWLYCPSRCLPIAELEQSQKIHTITAQVLNAHNIMDVPEVYNKINSQAM